MWGAGEKAARQAVADYEQKLKSSEIPRDEELAQCYAAKIALDTRKESEERVRTIQSLANLPHPACVLPLVRELVGRAKRWPRSSKSVDVEAVSNLLLEVLVQYSNAIPRQPTDGAVGSTEPAGIPSPS